MSVDNRVVTYEGGRAGAVMNNFVVGAWERCNKSKVSIDYESIDASMSSFTWI